jgi:septal ring factor EnvC (AmiA/AmiB activator)
MVDDYTKQLEQQLEEVKDKLAESQRQLEYTDTELRYFRDENEQLKDMILKYKSDAQQLEAQSHAICKAAARQGVDMNYADEMRKMLDDQRRMTAYFPTKYER